MKERPILFSAPMVRALLDGRKTQTRRVCKPMEQWVNQECREVRTHDGAPHHFLKGAESPIERLRCPYGQPGDRLWVRETVAEISCRLTYRADTDDGAHCVVKRWTPSIHMPREWSRILLEVVSVRVERLQDIGEADARAEGVTIEDRHTVGYCAGEFLPPSIRAYRDLWEQINGAGSWDANPWVWVVEFKRVAP